MGLVAQEVAGWDLRAGGTGLGFLSVLGFYPCSALDWASHPRRKLRLELKGLGLQCRRGSGQRGGLEGATVPTLGSGCQPTVTSCWLCSGLKTTPAQEAE